MPNYLALKSEILTDPTSQGYAGKTAQQQAVLANAPIATTRLVPIGELQELMLQQTAWPKIRMAAQQSTPPTGIDAATWAGIQATCIVAVDLLINYKAATVDTSLSAFQTAMGTLNAAGLLSNDEKAAILALSVGTPTSRAILTFGLPATDQDITAALAM